MARPRIDLMKADAHDPAPDDTLGLPAVPVVLAPVGHPRSAGEDDPRATRPEEILAEPPDARDISAELSAPPRRALPWLTLVLAGGVVAAGAFGGGALVEQNHLQGATSGARPSFAAARGGAGTASGRPFGGGQGGTGTGSAPGGSGTTVGTIKLVDGSTIYVTDAQGGIVKVTTAGPTKVTEASSGKVADLRPGQTVMVRGTRNAGGDIAAATVSEGGLGGGFGGRGGAGGAGG